MVTLVIKKLQIYNLRGFLFKKCLIFRFYFNQTRFVSTNSIAPSPKLTFTNNFLVEAALFLADIQRGRERDLAKLIFSFRNTKHAPKCKSAQPIMHKVTEVSFETYKILQKLRYRVAKPCRLPDTFYFSVHYLAVCNAFVSFRLVFLLKALLKFVECCQPFFHDFTLLLELHLHSGKFTERIFIADQK